MPELLGMKTKTPKVRTRIISDLCWELDFNNLMQREIAEYERQQSSMKCWKGESETHDGR